MSQLGPTPGWYIPSIVILMVVAIIVLVVLLYFVAIGVKIKIPDPGERLANKV